MARIDFFEGLSNQTTRDYVARVRKGDKAECANVALQYGKDYWDGDRKYGYGGYTYQGRHKEVARRLVDYYHLDNKSFVLDVGCGKGFLLYDLLQVEPDLRISGLDISKYAIENAKEEVRPFLRVGSAIYINAPDHIYDLVICINTLHNLYNYELDLALREITRVGKGNKQYICMESYRTEQEKDNLLNWQLTCRAFHTPHEWEFILGKCGYRGDYGFIFFS